MSLTLSILEIIFLVVIISISIAFFVVFANLARKVIKALDLYINQAEKSKLEGNYND